MSNPYESELKALKRSGRYRERHVRDATLIDAASNDYLGLAYHKELHRQACDTLSRYSDHSPKASMLVNGYHPIHVAFEEALCEANGFEAAIVMGSGFNANVGLIEALVRKGDILLMDEEYHASGIAGARMCDGEVIFFPHNDDEALKEALEHHRGKRIIVAIEGIYSMGGDCVHKEIIDLSIEYGAILIVDEAHSSGVIGEHLMGILDHYAIEPTPLMIKMGTLGKAYGSFGAYVLASRHICDYLINRAKNVIYATAPSLYDTALGHHALLFIQKHSVMLREAIRKRQEIIHDELGLSIGGLIAPIVIGDNHKVVEIQCELRETLGVHVGAIRQPTVKDAIIRLIARVEIDESVLREVCRRLTQIRVK
ncbi:aminotransferase class I/II-fold pyridoxal phosphate-dependent enzyme [Sulfuricurvum sp.]|uniref:aminotransferase class I/II-fold pyridoxal phosphate-dependent enzyme n=1 Tax=Sulfuricurvum sp. TaxID=2025608 RepID=UPI00199E47A4|nr:aminotransferase class I/II-fold pyridoxal phosphate-dependent enzyme [Sulfuricurvum sp.]MBD3806309.1 aminotransferase class I/II-fold pyridoxal phosphate-dependent enzyme [Sulfuricurvum sp.]